MLQNGCGIVASADGKVVGTTMSWNFGPDVSTLGMVIVSKSCQGHGIGRKLMNGMLDRLGGRTVVLNATAEGLGLYERLGFVATGTVCQHQSSTFVGPIVELLPAERVRPMVTRDRERMAEMFSQACGMDRRALFGQLHEVSRGVVLTRDNEPVGFALLRRFGRGWTIGPVVAPEAHGARALISHWLGKKMGRFCRLDVTASSGLSSWLEELGLPCVGRVTTMVRGQPPVAQDGVELFALASQALG